MFTYLMQTSGLTSVTSLHGMPVPSWGSRWSPLSASGMEIGRAVKIGTVFFFFRFFLISCLVLDVKPEENICLSEDEFSWYFKRSSQLAVKPVLGQCDL